MDFSDLIPSKETAPTERDSLSFDDLIPKRELPGTKLEQGLTRGLDMFQQFSGSAIEGLGSATGLESVERFGRDTAAFNRAELGSYAPGMTTEDIDGVGSLGGFVAEKLGESAIPMGTSIGAAALAGGVAGSAFGGVGAIPGALIGAAAATIANLPYMFGSFRERQKDADIEAGREIQVDEGAALMYALPASALDSVSDLFIVGKLAKPFKPLLESGSLLTRVTTNAATGATAESLTEVGQTVLERHQAGLSLTDEDAQREYFEAAVAGGLIGGSVSAATNIRKPKPTVENTGGGTDAAERAALRGDSSSTSQTDVAPDQVVALTGADRAREIMQQMRARQAAAAPKPRVTDPMSDDFVAPGRKTPAPAPAVDLTPEQRVAANQQAATEMGMKAAAPVTPEVTPAPVLAPTAQVEIPTEQVAAPVVPAPADAPVTEGTELEETLLSDTALNEEVPAATEGAEAAGDTLPTVPETPETLAAQAEALVDRKSKRKAVYIPPETLGEVEADALPMGKNVFSMRLPNGGMLFWNYTKIGLSKKDVTNLYNDGSLGQLLGLGPFNKAEVAASGGEQDLAVREINKDGVAVKDVAATEVTAPEQAAALEADKDEGSTVEIVPAEQVIADRQAAVVATSRRRSKKQEPAVRTLKDFDPEEVARIEAAANAKAEEAKATSAKRTIVLKDEATAERTDDAYDEQAFLRKRAAAEEELRTKKEAELAAKKAELQRKVAENDFKDAEDEAVSRIEANRTEQTKDKGRDKAKVATAIKAGRLVEQLRASLQTVTGSKAGFRMVESEGGGEKGALTIIMQMRDILREAGKQGIRLGRNVDDTIASPVAFLIDLRTQVQKLEKLPKEDSANVRLEIMGEVNAAIQDLNAYLVGNDATGLRERRLTEGGIASEGVGGVDVDSFADERAELDRDEETDETDPDDYELAPSNEPERAIEIDDSIPTFTAGENKTVKVEVKKDRSAALRAAKERLKAQGLTLPSQREGRGNPEAMGDLPRDGSEAQLANRTVTLAELKSEVFSPEALADYFDVLRNFSKGQKALQRLIGKRMYSALLDVVGDVPVHVLSDAYFELYAPNADAYYNMEGDYIAVRESVMEDTTAAMHAVMHEGSHAAFAHAIRESAELRRQLDRLLGLAREHAAKTGVDPETYGLKNVDEFLSETWANPKFQEFLGGVPVQKGAQMLLNIKPSQVGIIRSVLDWVKAKLVDVLGIRDALTSAGYKGDTASGLEATLEVGGRVLELSPRARQRYYSQSTPQPAGVLPMEQAVDPDSIEGKLRARGLDTTQARNVAAMIDEEFDGTATDEELDAIVGALGKPVGSQQGLTGPSPFMPPQLPGRVAKLFGAGRPPKAGPLNKALLYAMTLDFIDLKFRKYFGDKAGNALADYANAAFAYQKVAQDVAALHDLDFADFEDLRREKPAEAAKIQKLVAMLQATDIDIADGASNDHLKKTNARKYLQSKAALPEVQKVMASMDPETLKLVRRMARNFTASHNDYIRAVTETILDGLPTPLTKAVKDRIIDNVVNAKLDAQDEADVNDAAVFAMLERSEFLKKRKGSYFPAERFGEWVVTTDLKVDDPKITSVVTKSGRKTVPITTEVDGGTVRFIFDYTIRGSRGAVAKKVYDWVAKHELPLQSYVVKYRDRQTGEIVGKGDMDVTKDYDMVHEVRLQNKGVHFFEDVGDARAFEEQAVKDKAAGKLLRHSPVRPKHEQKHREHLIPPGALDAVFSSIDKNPKLVGNDTRKTQLKNAVQEAIIRSTVGNRYEKRLMGRQNIIGASDEVGRAAANYGRSVGNAIAQIRSGGSRADAMQRMREIAKVKGDDAEAGIIDHVVNELVRREDLDNGPLNNNQMLDNLSTINAIDKLMSPANWFLNMTQVPMNSLPYLGGKFGNVKAARTILSAYQRIGAGGALKSGLKNTGKAATQVGKARIDLDDVLGSIRKNVGAKYGEMFDKLIETGDITDNAGIENAQQLAGGRGMAGLALVKMDRIMRAMPNAIEAINRSTVAVASYDLALASGMSKADAIAATREVLRRTQFRYDETNKSRLMRSNPALRFFFTFKQYGQGQYQMLADALGRAMTDATPQERAQARKQLFTLFGMQVMAAGVFSLPAIEVIKTAVMLGTLLGLGEGWEDETEELRQIMRDSYGQTVEEIVSKGLLSKVLGVNLSGRMSWADLILGYPPRSGEKQDVMAWLGQTLAGPQGSMVYEFFIAGPKALIEGDYVKGLTLMLPVKTVADTVKAAGAAADGKMDPVDAAKQIAGFQSMRQARIADETGARIRESGRKKKEVADLIADYLNAVSRGDVVKAAAAIREYNASLPKDGRKINIGDANSGLEKRRRENVRMYQE